MSRRAKGSKGGNAIAAGLIAAIIVVSVIAAYLYLPVPSKPQVGIGIPSITITGPGGQTTVTTAPSAALQLNMKVINYDTGAAVGSAIVNVYSVNNARKDTVTVDGTSGIGQTGEYFTPGVTFKFHVTHTSYYPADYEMAVPSVVAGGAGQTQYYDLNQASWTDIVTGEPGTGAFKLKQRVAGASTTFAAQISPDTLRDTTMDTLASQPTWTTTMTNKTITGSTFTLNLKIDSTEYSVWWGVPVKYIDTSFQSQVLRGAFILAYNSTQPKSSEVVASGFTSINNPPTGWSVFSMALDGTAGKQYVHSTQTVYATKTYPVKFDLSSVTDLNYIQFRVFAMDFQYMGDIQSGGSSAAPTARGAYSTYGLTTILPNTTYSLTSSVPVGSVISFIIRYDS